MTRTDRCPSDREERRARRFHGRVVRARTGDEDDAGDMGSPESEAGELLRERCTSRTLTSFRPYVKAKFK
ncbi:hypothetical protein GCM10023195_08820 [Actinoallomurus liliacearum]|uniref:Uncharacterized protein n=1 Tax=Actinoallomurus liliacearum TaxID=1080073 RepID=A0ABP8TEC9_9ACTN